LIASGAAYRCFCTEEGAVRTFKHSTAPLLRSYSYLFIELEAKRKIAEEAGEDPKYDGTWRDADPVEVQKRIDNNEPYTVRFRVPKGKVMN
jgi:glutamyl-tRNA synthetase